MTRACAKPLRPAPTHDRRHLVRVWLAWTLLATGCQGDHLLASLAQFGEACGNGIDDDGDGQIDEDCPCGSLETQACFSGQLLSRSRGRCAEGQQACEVPTGGEFGYWGGCSGSVGPLPEECDGAIDDSCDGAVDEGCPCMPSDTRPCVRAGLGPPCEPGTQRCGEDGRWSVCLGAIGPEPDLCGDGIDNDCDGVIDRGCGCEPVPEICGDGIDNDCDGVRDEDACGQGSGAAWALWWPLGLGLRSAISSPDGGLWVHLSPSLTSPPSTLLHVDEHGAVSGRRSYNWVPRRIAVSPGGGFYFGAQSGIRARVVRVGADGRHRWGRLVGASGHTVAVGSLLATGDGGVLAGTRRQNNGPSLFMLLRLDAEGTLLWHRAYQEAEQDGRFETMVVRETAEGFVFVGSVGVRQHVVSVDAEGAIRWQKQYLSGGRLLGKGALLSLGPDRMVLAVGAVVVAFDPRDGTELWGRRYAEATEEGSPEEGFLARTPRGFVWLARVRDSPRADLFLSELSPDGSVLWAGDFGSPLVDATYPEAIVPRPGGGFVLAATLDYATVQSVGPRGDAPGCPLGLSPRALEPMDLEVLSDVDEGISYSTRLVPGPLGLTVTTDDEPTTGTMVSDSEEAWLCR